MPFAVQLDLDATTAAAIDGISDLLDQFDGVETVRQIGDVPHLSLAVYDAAPVDELVKRTAVFANAVPPLPLRLAHVGLFVGDPCVVFIGPMVDEQLLAVHRAYHAAMAAFDEGPSLHYRPGAWVPHVTLAFVRHDLVPACIGAIIAKWRPRDSTLEAIRVIRFRPVETLWLQRLAPDI